MSSPCSVSANLLDLPEESIHSIVGCIGANAVPGVLNLHSFPDSFHDAMKFCSLHPRLYKHLRTLFCSVHADGFEFELESLAPIICQSMRKVSVDGFGASGG